MKSVRLSGLAASSALALILALSSQPGQAQSTSGGTAQAAAPVPATAAQPADKPAAQDKADASAKPESASPQAAKTAQALPDVSVPLPHIVAPTEKDIHFAAPAAKTETAAAPSTDAKPDAKAAVKAETKTDTKAAPVKTEAKTTPTSEPKSEAKTEAKPEAQPAPKAASAAPPAPAKAAAAPVTPPAPAMDAAVAHALKDMVAGRLEHYVPRREDRAGVEAFYKKRDYKPLWVGANGAADARAKAAIAYLASVAADGLDPSDYPTPDFAAAHGADDLAAAELKLTNAVLIYAHDAQVGRVHFTRVGSDISFKLEEPNPAAVLAHVADSKDVAAALDGYNPPQPGFKALKAKLAELRAGNHETTHQDKKVVRIPAGPILRPGMRDERVVLLRKRLDVAGDAHNPLYDRAVMDAVKAFQMKADIGVDGMVGPSTLRALNGQHGLQTRPSHPIQTVIANMERWRWLPRKLSNSNGDYVMVNVPDYTLRLVHDGKTYWKTKIVVGKPAKATPMTSAEMKYITVNPTWNVPPSIIENEYLPALQEDPDALERIGLKIRQDPDGTVHIFQPPGAANALGRIRFNFPNKFLVYQHDTPDKYLFARATRAYSHGCMRVQDPAEYATKLLSLELPQDHYTPAKIESMYGSGEININFPRPIPVHLTYQTAFVDQNGKLEFRPDIYGRDSRMLAILDNARERRVAYIPEQRPPNTSSKPVRLPVGALAGDGGYVGGGYNGGGGRGNNFFDWLFGGGDAAPPPRYYRSRRHFIGPDSRDDGRYSRR